MHHVDQSGRSDSSGGSSMTTLCLVAVHHHASSGHVRAAALFSSLAGAGTATSLATVRSLHFQLFSNHVRGETARRSYGLLGLNH